MADLCLALTYDVRDTMEDVREMKDVRITVALLAKLSAVPIQNCTVRRHRKSSANNNTYSEVIYHRFCHQESLTINSILYRAVILDKSRPTELRVYVLWMCFFLATR